MEYFGLEHFMDLTEIVSADDQFLENAVEIRKMKAIIGCSASEFIRQYRIKKANEYLKAGKGSVSEIAYSVGFNNLSYFTKSFKEVYKINPSEVQEMS